MKIFRNRQAVKYILIMLGISAAATVLFTIICSRLLQNGRNQENAAIEAVFSEIQKSYPEVSTQELVEILNNPVIDAKSSELKAYGFADGISYISASGREDRKMIYISSAFFAVMQLVLAGCFCLYLNGRRKKLDELTGYIEMVADGNYNLNISDNSEDELSALENNLYKLALTLKEDAVQSRKQREALAETVADISHQLKTPLTSISVLLDDILDSPDMPRELQQKFLREISRQVFSTNWMVISMLRQSRLDAGFVRLEEKKIYVKDMLKAAADKLEILAELKGITFDIQFQTPSLEESAVIWGDPNWNREAAVNIMKNALEHSEGSDRIRIKVEDNSVYTLISIADHGKMVSAEDQKRIFTRYFSASGSESSIGIGLALAKSILEKQGGYLLVESNEKETTFMMKYLKCHRNVILQ